jgi:hypothetical protein
VPDKQRWGDGISAQRREVVRIRNGFVPLCVFALQSVIEILTQIVPLNDAYPSSCLRDGSHGSTQQSESGVNDQATCGLIRQPRNRGMHEVGRSARSFLS